MQIERTSLQPGLYFVATPIGSARDITLRALDILASADVLVAEDTRTLKHLMRLHGVTLGDRQVLAYHDHSGEAMRQRITALIAEGRSVAYASEAGTPLVADPGFQLGRSAIAAGQMVTTAPGASAVLAALTIAGLPSDRFLFAGFPPHSAGARRKWLAELADCQATLVLYESPKRVKQLLDDLVPSFGEERKAAVCRELTKKFEEVCRGTLAELQAEFADRSVKGEVVVLVDRGDVAAASDEDIEEMLIRALANLSVKDASAEVAGVLNLPKRQVYQLALEIAKREE
ncbi:16S rRNA (cytidine(1402)-2'-O)-methyltransferase [Actibacterium sp. XHP0104]|uniref:16S rRNA (cytidine(1402)-2'-O)-methyltransferase n=1 Tax=Actibacterium sp. XHP0104 TaxID=2984335 RepID=UPI0021E975EE|nr:16S rRNA (cytidine(1402)-2'-O)-methyltransferase [Actibacterium sp. XHP0104]MCV2882672.1 16S rRNA (cytidine(1402)-2'-O)-methyltransferase [Actibacterium sp. XHP0104]